uniref:F-box domain-containing protein n=1 Tax=Aegilops tauschii TaxID=37682 RepID=M8CRY3_AEGTA
MADAAANTRRCTDAIAALPEDVLLEVLSRVGNVKGLFMLAMTCRRWLRRFTDPAFLRGLCPGQGVGHQARLLGFFFQQTRFDPCGRMMDTRMMQHTSVFAPTFLPSPGSPLGRKACALTSFVADDDGTFNYAKPMAARRGIVLMKLIPRTLDTSSHHLGLCNPITGERHVIPPLKCSVYVHGYAIITAADSDIDGKQPPSSPGRFAFSQLLLATLKDHQVYLNSYSAATRSWSAPTLCAPTLCLGSPRFSRVAETSAVVHQGAAHWLCIDRVHDLLYKLSADVGTGTGTGTARASVTQLPTRAGASPLLCQAGEGGDDIPAAWLRTVIRIPMAVPYPKYHPLYQTFEKWFDFDMGALLVLYRSSAIFVLDLEKKVMEKVMDCLRPLSSDKLSRTPVAYEMDLVEFFVLQLGGLCRGLIK